MFSRAGRPSVGVWRKGIVVPSARHASPEYFDAALAHGSSRPTKATPPMTIRATLAGQRRIASDLAAP